MLPITIIILLTLCNQLNPSNGREEEQHSYRENPKPVAPGKNKVLNFGGIFPMTGGWAGGKGCRPAVDMALEDVNSNKNILPGFRLSMSAFDSKCTPGLGMNVLYELLYNEPTKLMLLGPGCSVVSTFVGQAARMWNLIVLSYGSSSPALSNRDRFPTFFRTHPSATLHNPTRIKLFKKFKWSRIATIQQTQEVFTSTIEDLEQQVKTTNIEIAVRTSFFTDPTNAVRNLKRQDARIIVGLFYEDMARRVFCEVYKQKLYGPKYVWFIIGWYPDNWWSQHDASINCTADMMKEALEGHLTTEGLMLNPNADRATVSQMTANEFQSKVKRRIGGKSPLSVTGYVEAPLAYDAVWALALALNKTQARLSAKGQSLQEFDYSNTHIRQEIYASMNDTNFEGVSGEVAFNSAGDRITWTQIEQMWNGSYVKLGMHNYNKKILHWDDIERWQGGMVPQDRTRVVSELRTVNSGLFIIMSLLAAVGIVAGVFLLIFNTVYQHRRHMKLSQPHINSVMLVGCIICFICIFLQGLDGRYLNEQAFVVVCQMRAWVLCMGFTLAYGSMFSKVWTIYRLTTRRKKEIKPLRDWEMWLVLGIFLALDLILLTVWQVMDPLHRTLEDYPLETPTGLDDDIKIKPQLAHCNSEQMNIWLGVMFGYKGILLLFGILLSYETRNVKVKQINDSKFVAMSIYNIVVLCIITAPVTLIIASHQDASFAFVAVAILLSSFLAMGLIFLPKIMELKNNPMDGSESTALTDSNATREEEERHQRLLQETDQLKQQIAEKEERINDLNKRIKLKSEENVVNCTAVIDTIPTDHSLSMITKRKPSTTLSHRSLSPSTCQEHTASTYIPSTHQQTAPSTHDQVTTSTQKCLLDRQKVNFSLNLSTRPSHGSQPELLRLPNTQVPSARFTSNRNSLDCSCLDSRDVGANVILPDHNSDSALPTSSTAKSSKTSALSENFSESYC